MAERPRGIWTPVWWLRLVVGSLAIGIVGQIAIAWGLCWYLPASGDFYAGAWQWGETKFSHDDMEWFGKRVTTWGPFSIPEHETAQESEWRFAYINSYPSRWSFSRDAEETRMAAREYREHRGQNTDAGLRMEFAAGWPWLSLRGLLRSDITPMPPGAAPRWRLHGVLAGRSESHSVRGECRSLPLLPIWGGLAADTLVLGGSVFLTVVVWTGARRRLRFGRGRCPACGYDLAFDLSAGCAECGWRKEPGPG